MSDDIRMDSHKLIYHPRRVADFMDNKMIYPLEIEIGLSGACNHRCIFCAVDYMGYDPVMLDTKVLLKNMEIMSRVGVKSVIYAGEGEPLLNPNASEIMNKGKAFGLDCALSTNGVFLTEEFSKETLKTLTWVRFSIAGGTEETYQKIHRSKANDLEKVLKNMQCAVDIKNRQNLKTTLGAQLLLLPENKDEVIGMAKQFKEMGLDYFTVKPFLAHPQSHVQIQVDYDQMMEMQIEIEKYATEKFKIYFRHAAMEDLKYEKTYSKCNGVHFMTHIDARGYIYPCVAFVGNEQLKYGNLYENDFDIIWRDQRSIALRNSFCGDILKTQCRKACRLNQINKYLAELEKPNDHVNFI